MKSLLALTTFLGATALGHAALAACPAWTATEVTCTRYGNRLVAETPSGKLTLFGNWSQRDAAGRFTTSDGFTIAVPGGFELPVPAVGDVTVSCASGLDIQGDITGMPGFGPILSGLEVTTELPSFRLGFARGEDLADLEAPIDACSPYLFFAFESSVAVSVGEASVGLVEGDDAKILVNPWDPSFIVEVGGRHVAQATAGFVAKAGMGFSAHRRIHWTSALDLPTGFGANAGFAPAELDAHVWTTGKFGLIPVPESPVQLWVDGDLAVNLAQWKGAAEAVIASLSSGAPSDIRGLVDAASDSPANIIKNAISFGGNLASLSLSIGEYFSIDLADGAFLVDDGKLRFAADAWTPGAKLMGGQTGQSLIDNVMKLVMIKARSSAAGYVDASGYHFELTGNFQVGPLAFNNAKLIIDSKAGVTMNRGNMSFDPVAFANDLQTSFGCDFKSGVAGCRIAGFQVLSASASIVGGQPKMNVTLDLLALGSVAFEMTSGSPLQFSAQVSVGQALGGFNAGNGKLTIQGDSVTIETKFQSLTGSLWFKGSIAKRQGGLRYSISAQGKTGLAGIDQLDVKATLANPNGGAPQFTIDATLYPSLVDAALNGSKVVLHGQVDPNGTFALTGTADWKIAGYTLGSLTATLSNAAGSTGLALKGRFDAQIVHSYLEGLFVKGQPFYLVGNADITVDGFRLSNASLALSRDGMRLSSWTYLGALQLYASGTVATNGAVTVTGSATVNVPILADLEVLKEVFECGTKTIEVAGQCFTGLVQTGWEWVESSAQCAPAQLKQVTNCIEVAVPTAFDWVTDMGRCAAEGIQCGMQYVTDGTRCGFELMGDKLALMGQCINDFFKQSFDGVDVLHYPPASCLEFVEPRTCELDIPCPSGCLVATDWTNVKEQCEEKMIEVAGSCYVPKMENLPTPCTALVAETHCPPEKFIAPDQNVGVFQGTISVTLGSTVSASVTGQYIDLGGDVHSWGVVGSATLGPTPRVCVSIPETALPMGVTLGMAGGLPIFCSDL